MKRTTGSLWTWIFACTLLSILVLGYHPTAEDGGIYLTAYIQRLHPDLYPHSHAFAHAHLDISFYLPFLQQFHELLPVSIQSFILLVYILATLATVAAIGWIARLTFNTEVEERAAVLVASLALSIPAAGTALYLADPYLTARSLSTPLVLAGFALVLHRQWLWLVICLLVTAAVHPLMALWGGVFLLGAIASRARRTVPAMAAAAACLLAIFSAVYFASPHESGLALTLAHTRDYWYLSQWEWYEWLGLIGPPIILLGLRPSFLHKKQLTLCDATLFAFLVSALISVLFVHFGDSRVLIARMQPLRTITPAYVLFLMLLGSLAGKKILKNSVTTWALGTLLIILPLLMMQRSLYEASNHIELPWRTSRNGWVRAFDWIRANTPSDALFAMDPDYTTDEDEDAHVFRAIAQRSSLPDAAKDGGVASVYTKLASEWAMGVDAQKDIEKQSDIQRLQHLKPLGVNWIILRKETTTSFACPFANEVVKVCRLP